MTIRESPSRVEARAGRIIDAWMRAGFREVEVYAKFARTETAAAAGGAILRAESREESGLAVRAF